MLAKPFSATAEQLLHILLKGMQVSANVDRHSILLCLASPAFSSSKNESAKSSSSSKLPKGVPEVTCDADPANGIGKKTDCSVVLGTASEAGKADGLGCVPNGCWTADKAGSDESASEAGIAGAQLVGGGALVDGADEAPRVLGR